MFTIEDLDACIFNDTQLVFIELKLKYARKAIPELPELKFIKNEDIEPGKLFTVSGYPK